MLSSQYMTERGAWETWHVRHFNSQEASHKWPQLAASHYNISWSLSKRGLIQSTGVWDKQLVTNSNLIKLITYLSQVCRQGWNMGLLREDKTHTVWCVCSYSYRICVFLRCGTAPGQSVPPSGLGLLEMYSMTVCARRAIWALGESAQAVTSEVRKCHPCVRLMTDVWVFMQQRLVRYLLSFTFIPGRIHENQNSSFFCHMLRRPHEAWKT